MVISGMAQTIFWLVAMVVLLVIEAVVPGLISIWFALGALAALISALFHAPIWLQLVWFVVVSVLALILTRPLVKKWTRTKKQPTNADMVLGEEAVVTETISNTDGKGMVKVKGAVWSARSADDSIIPAGKTVTVKAIEGVKLIVEP